MPAARLLVVAGWLGLLAAAWSVPAGAQPIYRITGPDGKVTFSDRPPADPGVRASTAPVVPLPGNDGNGSLPFELRAAASRYPVVLYTQPDCGPCDSGRTYLSGRGIPFSEKTVSSREDIDALQRLIGAAPSLPVLTVGSQQLKGFASVEWQQFLDAAGYPQTSQLPTSYRRPPASPLVAAQAPPQPR
ncbi:DUF4124 domain-containing protein, partial [Ramlibacter sp.]|uniref:DUF4124 domain-containing protein n=1 Tax=Ramlibacter sp. TaxID=1917967 RepID=UPI0017C686C6